MSSTEKRWAVVWGAWVAAFAVAETVAVRSGQPEAPLSHHARRVLLARRSRAGALLIAGGAAWLTVHLFGEVDTASLPA